MPLLHDTINPDIRRISYPQAASDVPSEGFHALSGTQSIVLYILKTLLQVSTNAIPSSRFHYPDSRHCCFLPATYSLRLPPCAKNSIAAVFFIRRSRIFCTLRLLVSPSTPQFILQFHTGPSRLSSPFASLCFCP